MRVLSLGAGVQSSTLLLMAEHGEVVIDAAVFADTQWEPQAVYDHLAWLESVSHLPIHRVSDGNIREDFFGRPGFAALPLHLTSERGTKAQLRRQCTAQYKVRPIQRLIRSGGATAKAPVSMLIGISLDEAHRMREPRVRYVQHVYPLVDMRMSRGDCLAWLDRHGYPQPPKSACIGCPFQGNARWRDRKLNQPEEWADAVAFDSAIRAVSRIKGDVYLHASLQPLEMVDLRNAHDRGQMDLFGEECSGLCGV